MSERVVFVDFADARQDILTAEQMRQSEADAIESGAVTGLSMMETAGRGVVSATLQHYSQLESGPQTAVILCGPGNNGGDGYVIARVLSGRGWKVRLFALGNVDRLPPDARRNADSWRTMGAIEPLENLEAEDVRAADVVFDSLFGTGLIRPLGANICDALQIVGEVAKRVVAVDLPSGFNTDTGKILMEVDGDHWPRADLIATFQWLKPVHLFGETCRQAEDIVVIDLGIETFGVSPIAQLGMPRLNLSKGGAGHKYDYGHALVMAGGYGRRSVGVGGAGRLAARAALRIGAGCTTLGCPPAALSENAAHLNAVMLTPIGTPQVLVELCKDRKINSVCLGPGFGIGDDARQMVLAALETGIPCVLDADALTNFQTQPADLFDQLHNNVVLTPHRAEFARIFPDLSDAMDSGVDADGQFGELQVVKAAAERCGATVLLKGAVTVIASPQGALEISAALHANAAPWLATAGSGDVLAGMITGLLARGFAPLNAAVAASHLHVQCAQKFGAGLIAEDLPEMLPAVLQDYENQQWIGQGHERH